MFTPEQEADLIQLRTEASKFGADIVIIGATALRLLLDLPRFTADLDLTIALELDDFLKLADQLESLGWTRDARQEQRWQSPGGSAIDLVPAGPNLRAEGQIVWPESQFSMGLAGFEHVFTHAIRIPAGNTELLVAPPHVIAILKIAAYVENPLRRQRDLDDLRFLLSDYLRNSDRIFSDDVFDANLSDIEYANAFLLGLDIGQIANRAEAGIFHQFLNRQQLPADETTDLAWDDPAERDAFRYHHQLAALVQGFDTAR